MMINSIAKKPDYAFIIITFLLVLSGIVFLSSASSVISQRNFGTPNYYLLRHLLIGVGLGIIGWFVGYKIPHIFWRKIALFLFLISLVMLFLIFIPRFGFSIGGAQRWLQIGGFSFQPSELVKLSFVIYLAAWLGKRKDAVGNFFYGPLPFIALLIILGLLIVAQPDVGTLGVIVFSALAVFFVAGSKWRHILMILFIGILIFLVLIQSAPYRMKRVATFLNPAQDIQGTGYQINQSLIAAGSGGIFGLGFGKSKAKHFFIPQPTNDSIFAIIAEELGFIGAVGLLALFIIFGVKGFLISLRANESFSKLLGVGITFWIVLQAFINIAAIIGLIPLTGLPLPFISYGGTAMVITMVGAGILANISKEI